MDRETDSNSGGEPDWRPPFMLEAGWLVLSPQKAIRLYDRLREHYDAPVYVANSLKQAFRREDYDAIDQIQRGLSWPWLRRTLLAPQELVREYGDSFTRFPAHSVTSVELDREIGRYSQLRGPGNESLNQLLAEEFLFMKLRSTIVAKNRRPFAAWRDRGKSILEMGGRFLERKREVMSRLGNLRFFLGWVVILGGLAGGPLGAIAGGSLLIFYDP